MSNILNKYDEITNNKFVIALMMFIFIIPMGMLRKTYAVLPMFKIRFILSLLVTIKFGIHLKKNKKFPPMLIVGIIYCLGRIIRTYVATNMLKSSLFDYSSIVMLPLIMIIECGVENNAKGMIEGILIYIETILFLNIFCIAIPQFAAMFDYASILGYDNYHFAYFCLALIIPYIYYYICKNKFTFTNMIIVWITTVLFSLKYWSATNIVAVFVFFISLFISKKFKIANIVSYVGVYLVSFVSIVLFNAQYLLSFLIVDVLHKSLSLSLREYVWRDFKNEIVKSPIIGFGYQNDLLYNPEQKKMLYAHNHILQELFNGGIVMYLIYIWFVILPAKKLWENRDNEISKALSSIIFAILIHCLCESVSVSLFVFIFTIAYHVEKYIELGKANCHE